MTNLEDLEDTPEPLNFLVKDKKGRTFKIQPEEATKIAQSMPIPYRPSGIIDPSNAMLAIQSYLSRMKTIHQEIRAQKLSFRGKIDNLSIEEFDELIKQRIKLGDSTLVNRVATINEKILEETREREKQKAEAQAKSEIEAKERNRFTNKFLRLCGYLTIKQYREELEKAITTATLAEVDEAKSRLLKGERPELTTEQRSFALTWLNSHQNAEKEPEESPKSLARKIFDLGRGH